MRLQFHDGAIRAFREHAERQVASHVRDQADKLQGVYDRVLAASRGKPVDDVKVLLAQEWRSTFDQEITDPQLSRVANVLAEGRRIEVQTRVQG